MLKVLFYSSFGFASIFSLFSLIFYFGDWDRLLLVFLMGLFVGIVAAPEFEPKSFKNARMYQVFGGGFFGIVLGVFFGLDFQEIVSISLICAVLGLLAPYWLKYIQIP